MTEKRLGVFADCRKEARREVLPTGPADWLFVAGNMERVNEHSITVLSVNAGVAYFLTSQTPITVFQVRLSTCSVCGEIAINPQEITDGRIVCELCNE